MTNSSDRMGAAKSNLAKMQARIAIYQPIPKVESGLRRGKKHSARTLPVPQDERSPPVQPSNGKAIAGD